MGFLDGLFGGGNSPSPTFSMGAYGDISKVFDAAWGNYLKFDEDQFTNKVLAPWTENWKEDYQTALDNDRAQRSQGSGGADTEDSFARANVSARMHYGKNSMESELARAMPQLRAYLLNQAQGAASSKGAIGGNIDQMNMQKYQMDQANSPFGSLLKIAGMFGPNPLKGLTGGGGGGGGSAPFGAGGFGSGAVGNFSGYINGDTSTGSSNQSMAGSSAPVTPTQHAAESMPNDYYKELNAYAGDADPSKIYDPLNAVNAARKGGGGYRGI